MLDFPDMTSAKASQLAPVNLHVVNPVDLAFKPVPHREWIVEDWLPIGCVTALYGDGGVGKTLLAQQLMTSTALGGIWCGREVTRCRSFGLFCEDDEAELHHRQAAICAGYGVGLGDLEAMRWVSGVGQDNALATLEGDTTPLYDAIRKSAIDLGARLVVLDTAADLFAGNENDRYQVRRFIGQLNRLAIELSAAVLLNAHPSRAGLNSGNLDGGSTAWSNSVRSRWSLARPAVAEGEPEDTDARVLERRKANYANIGDKIRLQWRDGALMPPTGTDGPFDRLAKSLGAEEVFMTLLTRMTAEGRPVSDSRNAPNWAPKTFAAQPDRQGFTKRDFDAAMQRLFAAGRIKVVDYGRDHGRGRPRKIEAVIPGGSE